MALVLVVENEDLIRWSLARRLERLGHEVLLAASLATATDLLRCARPDLVILDLGLPDGHGLELLERSPELAAATPVVVLTAVEDCDDERRAVRLGARAYLVKPVEHHDLSRLVTRHLTR